eukprot:scaffold27535_cov69-Cyclotella_meneghiniana.AAC.2
MRCSVIRAPAFLLLQELKFDDLSVPYSAVRKSGPLNGSMAPRNTVTLTPIGEALDTRAGWYAGDGDV